ncbi:P2X purinoceptor 4-like [Acipenser ruthenus]|uniref:P2X purinoceptor 4-like n=1 Tax=Acipenser ruthenus TaxID=7906 RepID=UPI00274109FE|nr:P2X purinoceptor 4-like [Acipenser ruthenus]
MSFSCGCCRTLGPVLFEYDTPRIVSIKSRKVGLINRLVQLGILAYVIGWVFVWQKGYQQFDSVISSVTTKVKGVAVTNTTDQGVKIWDVADYIIPPQEEASFFVMTNLIMTLNQQQGRCPEMPEDSPDCISDSNCTAGEQSSRSNGIQTGKCVPVHNSTAVHTCEVLAWCPLENDVDLSQRNILPHINGSYLKQCVFNRTTDPDCPIFRLGDIVREAGEDFQEIAVEGGVMGIQIKWDCDLDQSVSKCVPQYTFRRLDNKDVQNTVAPGYNFRFAKYYKGPGEVESRTLIKAYGIRFDVMVFGKLSLALFRFL